MSSLKDQINTAVQTAMRNKEEDTVNILRSILTEFKQFEVDNKLPIDDPQIIILLDKMAKRGHDAARQFTNANRADLADKELLQIKIIEQFMPNKLDFNEMTNIIKQTIEKLQATTNKDTGKVLQALTPQLQGKADLQQVSALIKQLLE